MAVISGFASELQHNVSILESMYQFRHRVFHRRLGWEVNI